MGIKLDVPEFEGCLQPYDFNDWLHIVEKIFDLKDILDDKRVKIIAIKLRKLALIWWENLMRQWEQESRSKIKIWEKMQRELTHKYLSTHYRQEMFIKFHNLQQRNLTIEEYRMEFELLKMKCDVREPEE